MNKKLQIAGLVVSVLILGMLVYNITKDREIAEDNNAQMKSSDKILVLLLSLVLMMQAITVYLRVKEKGQTSEEIKELGLDLDYLFEQLNL